MKNGKLCRKVTSDGKTYLPKIRQEITRQADRIHLPKSLIEHAIGLAKTTYEQKILKRPNTAELAAAVIYIACERENVRRSYKEIEAIAQVKFRIIGKLVKQIKPRLPVLPANDTKNETEVSKISPVVRLTNDLELDRRTHMCVEFIVEKAKELSILTGKNPLGIAAAAVFMACHASKTCPEIPEITEIARLGKIGELTVRNNFRVLVKFSEQLFHPKFELKIPHHELKRLLKGR